MIVHGQSSWIRVTRGDSRAREIADRHYTRQTPGSSSFVRPGYNLCLMTPSADALFIWWRPKWEDGRPGTTRMDKLRVIECTLFRNESKTLSSMLIRDAVTALSSPYGRHDLWLYNAGPIDGLVTGVRSHATSTRRSRRSSPGQCFVHAGWRLTDRRTKRADTWLELEWSNE